MDIIAAVPSPREATGGTLHRRAAAMQRRGLQTMHAPSTTLKLLEQELSSDGPLVSDVSPGAAAYTD